MTHPAELRAADGRADGRRQICLFETTAPVRRRRRQKGRGRARCVTQPSAEAGSSISRPTIQNPTKSSFKAGGRGRCSRRTITAAVSGLAQNITAASRNEVVSAPLGGTAASQSSGTREFQPSDSAVRRSCRCVASSRVELHRSFSSHLPPSNA